MRNWDISTLDVPPHNPTVLDSEEEGRAIVINLPSGERLNDNREALVLFAKADAVGISKLPLV